MPVNFKSEKTKLAARITSLLLVIALLTASLPLTGEAFAMQNCGKSHTVVSGDTLSAIAAKYGTTVQELATLNDLTAPYTLTIGQVICVPGSAATATPTGSSSSKSSSKDTVSFQVIDRGGKFDLVVEATAAKSIFTVRVSRRTVGSMPKWYKIGSLKTKKEGTITRRYRLPDNLIDEDINICLKNVRTNKTFCRSVYR